MCVHLQYGLGVLCKLLCTMQTIVYCRVTRGCSSVVERLLRSHVNSQGFNPRYLQAVLLFSGTPVLPKLTL